MNYNRLNKITRSFLMATEGKAERPNVFSYLQSITETLGQMRPKSGRERNRVEMIRSNLREVRRHIRSLEKEIMVLEEQVKILEEGK
jgi:septation ring formation regulator EzrA